MAKTKPDRVCRDCIHFHACQMWTSGILGDTDARPCRNYETPKQSSMYYLGRLDADKRNKPMKPQKISENFCLCPICGNYIGPAPDSHYCYDCGQALDWTEQEG